ncbi:MAG: aminotransferase class III-fold pyridoxal phosphate-dependent enzyme [Planctomycetes bacterium]|nr:aminotransferase class III-fold pyridoxal phosphate-dependent enzyme [Planctomycetota bacterium]
MKPDDGGSLAGRAIRVLAPGPPAWARPSTMPPIIARRARGPYLFDIEDRRYVDFVMAWGSVALGYAHPVIDSAVRSQLEDGNLFSLTHSLEIEVAERLIEVIPHAERVAFGKNGSDVCCAAVRLARAITGREGILHYGYHGFHDWSQAVNPTVRGVPSSLRAGIHTIEYGDEKALRSIFAEHGSDIAGVILEPMRHVEPPPGYFTAIRALTEKHGALLIFDEMVTGFRRAPASCSELFGVEPDLSCFGKALSNGYALSALVGRASLLDEVSSIGFGMTARGESLALAASRAAFDVRATLDVSRRIADAGRALRDGVHELSIAHGLDIRLVGHPSMMTFVHTVPNEVFLAACLREGILTNGHVLPSAAHDDDAIRTSLDGFDRAFAALARTHRT